MIVIPLVDNGKLETKLEKRYVKPFKNLVKRHLIDIQKLGSPENWSQENFKLYNDDLNHTEIILKSILSA